MPDEERDELNLQDPPSPGEDDAEEEVAADEIAADEEPGEEAADVEDEEAPTPDKGAKKHEPPPDNRRWDKLYWEKSEAKREAEYWRNVAEGKVKGPPPEKSAPPPRADDFKSYEEYLDARQDWRNEQKEITRREEQRKLEDAQRVSTVKSRINEGRDKYDDFDSVVYVQDLSITPAMVHVLAFAENPADIAYYLGKNKAEAERIAELDPIGVAREIGKLEAKLLSLGPEPRKTTHAPKQTRPVGGHERPTRKAEDMSAEEYIKWKDKQEGYEV